MSQVLKRNLSLVECNANGIGVKHSEFLEFLDRLKPDVLLFSETHLTPVKRFRLPNYVCYRDDRPGQAGGCTVVVVKASIGYHCVALPQRTHHEGAAIVIHGALGGVLAVAAYKPPQRELLFADLEAVLDSHGRV